MNSLPRERKCAVVDKKKSLLNYIKSDSNTESKQEALKRLSQNPSINIEQMLKGLEIEDLPMPPVHSNTEKNYKSDSEDTNVLNKFIRAFKFFNKSFHFKVLLK